MTDILKVLSAFFISRVLIAALSLFVENYAVLSVVLTLFYVLIFILYGERQRIQNVTDKRKGAFLLLFFLAFTAFLSIFTSMLFSPVGRDLSLVSSLVAVLIVPIGEELFFRATLFKTLEKELPLFFSIIMSSAIFALVHSGTAAMIVAFFAGAVLCIYYRSTKNIFLCIICHAANNLIAVTVTVSENLQLPILFACLVLSVVLFIFSRK